MSMPESTSSESTSPEPTTARTALEVLNTTGIGFRQPHAQNILEHRPEVAWFEALTDNYLTDGGLSRAQLFAAREHYPMALHGVGMSLGGATGVNRQHVQAVKHLSDQLQPLWISEHLCWSHNQHTFSHELLPLPFTEEALNVCVTNIQQAQEILGQQLLIENVSAYVSFAESQLSEVEFMTAVAERADCWILLDINNIYVNAQNLGVNATQYLQHVPAERVREIHLGGYTEQSGYLLDSHSRPVTPPVWALYQQWCQQHADTPTLIEWDNDLPAFDVLLQERDKAVAIQAQTLNHKQA